MKKLTIMMATLLSLGATSTAALAQDFKVGYVSLDRLVAESGMAKGARNELEGKFKSREKGLDSKAAAFLSIILLLKKSQKFTRFRKKVTFS